MLPGHSQAMINKYRTLLFIVSIYTGCYGISSYAISRTVIHEMGSEFNHSAEFRISPIEVTGYSCAFLWLPGSENSYISALGAAIKKAPTGTIGLYKVSFASSVDCYRVRGYPIIFQDTQ